MRNIVTILVPMAFAWHQVLAGTTIEPRGESFTQCVVGHLNEATSKALGPEPEATLCLSSSIEHIYRSLLQHTDDQADQRVHLLVNAFQAELEPLTSCLSADEISPENTTHVLRAMEEGLNRIASQDDDIGCRDDE